MKCFECGTDGMKEESREIDFDGVALIEGKVAVCPKCGNEDELYDRLPQLRREIVQALTDSPARLRPHELKWLRKAMGASGRDWAEYVSRDPATISRYENGKEPYPLEVEKLLRLTAKIGEVNWEHGVAPLGDPTDDKKMQFVSNSQGNWVRR